MDEIRVGQHADRLLEDEVFRAAVSMADERFVAEWRRAETLQEREQAHARQAALAEVLASLRSIVGSGELAAELERLQSRAGN